MLMSIDTHAGRLKPCLLTEEHVILIPPSLNRVQSNANPGQLAKSYRLIAICSEYDRTVRFSYTL